MGQQTFSDIEYSNRKRKTKREEFLCAMEQVPDASTSTKNKKGKRDSKMHQAQKGNE